MSKLERLRTSILNMSHDERLEMLREVRESRRMSKAPIVKEKKQHKTHNAMEKLVANLSDAERTALLAQLGGEDASS